MHDSIKTSMHVWGSTKHINYIIIALDRLLNEGTVTGNEATLSYCQNMDHHCFYFITIAKGTLLRNMDTLFSISANLNNNL